MIEISKAEAAYVRSVYPEVHIAKTRHKRYLEESLRYLILLPENVEAARIVRQMQRFNERRQKPQANGNRPQGNSQRRRSNKRNDTNNKSQQGKNT